MFFMSTWTLCFSILAVSLRYSVGDVTLAGVVFPIAIYRMQLYYFISVTMKNISNVSAFNQLYKFIKYAK